MRRREKIAKIIGIDPNKYFKRKLVLYVFTRVIFILVGAISLLFEDYLTAFLCAIALVFFLLPTFLYNKFNIAVPAALEISAVIFTFMCVVGGEIGHLYAQFPLWDKILHTFSGFLIAAIGLAFTNFFTKRKSSVLKLTPFFAVCFAFFFAIGIEVIWEVFEYAVDLFTGTTDMQADYFIGSFTSKKAGGETNPFPVVVGNIDSVVIHFKDGAETLVLPGYIDIGLADTMLDLIVGAIGAMIFCAIELIALKKRDKRMQMISESFVPKRNESEEEIAVSDVMCEVVDEFFDKAEKFSKK
ncbi:MAG: hypothetical protein IJX27_00760 [Clostridia bacterium]|nr:hypothetical protein [Clostridia bacterium]